MILLDVRVADTSIGEAAAKGGGEGPQRGFGVGVDRASQEYKDVFDVLEKASVGGKKGAGMVDRGRLFLRRGRVRSDAAVRDDGRRGLQEVVRSQGRSGGRHSPGRAHQEEPEEGHGAAGLPDLFPNGFPVTIKGRTLHVLPMPKT